MQVRILSCEPWYTKRMKLLTRRQFFESVMKRDKKCVYCNGEAVDAHHLIDRKCFSDGGYYEDNGVSLCSECHLSAEHGTVSPQQLRHCAGIINVVLPDGFDPSLEYDKWGKPIEKLKSAIDQCFMPIQPLRIQPEMFEEILAQFIIDCGLKDTFINYAKDIDSKIKV